MGNRQVEGIDFFETYAPVVSWSTVRLLLSLSLIFGLETRQVDYANAFVQAELKEDVYIEVPRGFAAAEGENMVMKLNRSLYGLRQAPLKFFEHLSEQLEKRGFKAQKEIDPCLFLHKDMVCLVYVDDCLFFGKDGKKIDDMIAWLQDGSKVPTWSVGSKKVDGGMELTVENDVSAFLGIDFKRNKADGTIKLTQEGLIDRVIKAAGLEDCNPDQSPAAVENLGSDPEGEPFDGSFDYASVVGMLMYLAGNSRPEIAYAVHSVAKYTHAPKQSHGKAVKWIVHYLKGTATDGLILSPSKELVVDCYVDASFADAWGSEDPRDPASVKSRTGFVILVANCPLIWVSKVQSLIACSTLEAEYIALSHSMRELIPLRRLVKTMAGSLGLQKESEARTYSKVFEDNNGALTLANAPKLMPRTKYIGLRFHWF